MTEPDVASSDATNVQMRIERRGAQYVINGRKWWITGAASNRCKLLIVMGKTDIHAPRHQQQSMILVPIETEGVEVERDLTVFGFNDVFGHCEISFTNVCVPQDSVLGMEGEGFAMSQARLGPGRIHHCMRCIGAAERALELTCRRVISREAFGGPLAEQGVVRDWIAASRLEIDQARLLTLNTAWLMDAVGNREAHARISGIKAIVPQMAAKVVDRAIQAFGAAGLSQDFPLAYSYATLRTLRLADGPDEVHKHKVAMAELKRYTNS
jgi:acyl-CoA dehydrogenase